MKKIYKKEITNKGYAIRYWNAIRENEAIQWATMGHNRERTAWVIEWCYR